MVDVSDQYRDILEKTIREAGIKGNYEVSVFEVDEGEMRKLHREHMAKLGYVEELHDVLSFPLDRAVGPDGITRLGDIVVCPSYAKTLGEDMEMLVKHGCLHLVGVHHE